MKKFNFLTNKMKWLFVPLVFFTLGVGNAWGANQTYTLVSDVSTLTSSDKILIVAYNGSSYYALKNNQKTTADNLPATSVTISSNTITADLETNYTWYAEYKDNATISSTSYRRYYFKSTKGNWYLQNAGAVKSKIDSKNATDGQNIWVVGYTGVNSSYSVTGLWNQSASRMLTVRSSDFRAYGSANFNDIDGHTVYFYKKAVSCDKSVGVTKGTATNGTVNTISSASVATCSSTASERRVTITITPAECYDAPSTLTWTKSSGTVTASKQSGPTDNGDGTYSYVYQFAQNDNGAGTFGVTCTAKDPGKTVNFDAGPGVSASSSLTETCDGSGVTLPAVTASGVCKGWTTFAGWATSAVSDSTTTSVTVYAAGSKYTPASDNMTLYAVYSKVKGGAGLTSVVGGNMSSSLPSGWSKSGAGQYSGNGVKFDDEGDWILSPDFSSQNLTKVTVKFKAGNNGSAGSVLRFEAIDKDGYEITGVDFSPTEAYDNQSTENSVVIDAGEKIYTIAVELTDKTSNVGMKYCEVFKSSSTTYYCSDPTCCTQLGTINGSISLTQGGTSVTVKDWGAVTNAGKYTVKCYEYNEGTSSWGLKATQENITNISTGATFSSLTLNAKYKFSVQAIATNSAYCDGDETEVTTINSTSVTSTPFQLRYAIHIDDANNDNWVDYWLDPTANDDEGSVEITLSGPRNYYQFQVKGGWSGWWGQTGTSTIPADTEWTLNGGSNVRLQTWIGGTYTFTVDLSGTNPKVTITFPPANQAAGKIVYWDASIHGNNWTKLIFRVGTDANSNAGSDCKVSGQLVPGTDQFYKVTTAAFSDMRAWAIANNAGWTGSQTNGVYRTNDFGDYNVTKSSVYQDYVVGNDGVTLIPASEGTLGDKSYNNNCYFYPVTKTDGMLTHNVAIGAKPTGGSITITYTNTSGTSGQTVTDGNNADLAHRCILNVVATPETGYNLVTFTKNSSDFTGPNYILTEDVTFAATFTLKQTTVMLNNESATTAGASSVTATYSQAVPSIAANLPAKTGYVFGGYFTEKNGAGTQYINADGSSAQNWDIEDATKTLYAKWTPKRCTVTLTAGTGSNGEAKFDYDATAYYSFSPAVRVGWTCTGYWTETGGTGTKILEADGSRAANVAGWWVDGKWSVDNTSATLYAGWENTYGGDEFELVQDLSELSAGKKIVILDKDHAYALGTSGTNNRSSVAAAAASNAGFSMSGDNNVVTLASATAVQVITLESSGASNRYYMNVENGYLYANGTSSNNYLKTRANNETNAEQGQFLFGLTDGDFTIRAQSGDSYNTYLREYSTSTFSCYSTAASNKAVLVYVKRESCDDPATALSVSASPSAISTATGYNTSTLSTANGNGNDVVYSVISANKANATISGTTTKTFSASAAGTYTVQAFQLKNENICRQIATTDITVTTPVLTTSKNSHTFEKTKTGNSRTTNTVTISGTNLVENVSVTYTGDTEYFTVTPSSISASDAMSSAQALTITYAPTVAGSHSITITISSTGAVDKTVTVSGTAADFFDVTFHISGGVDVVRSVESGEKPELPDNPESCDATSTAFVGWATAPWVGKIASVSDKTIHTSNATMSPVTAATDYYAVWAKEDASANVANAWAVINEDFANASGGSATSSGASSTLWPSETHPCESIIEIDRAYEAGGSVKLGGKSNEGYIQTKAITASEGTKIRIAFKVKGWSSVEGDIKISSDDDQFSEQTITYTHTDAQAFESKYVDVTVAAGKSNPKIKIATSAKRAFIDDVVISVYYSDYLTTCCENTGLTFGTILSPVTSYEIVRTSSAAATIDCNFESSTATEIKWYKTSRAARTFVTPTGPTSSTAPSGQLAEMTIDIANKELTASSVGVYTITIKQDEATIAGQKYCESFAEVTVTVKVRDRFVDMMNGEAVDADDGNPTITKDDTGGGIYTPTESEFSEDDICKSTRRKLIGWIKESDLNTGYAGRVNDITDMKTDNPATNKVIAPNTQVVATGCTWYAVWADID